MTSNNKDYAKCKRCGEEKEDVLIKDCSRTEHMFERQIAKAYDNWLEETKNADYIKCDCCSAEFDYAHGAARAYVKDFIKTLKEVNYDVA